LGGTNKGEEAFLYKDSYYNAGRLCEKKKKKGFGKRGFSPLKHCAYTRCAGGKNPVWGLEPESHKGKERRGGTTCPPHFKLLILKIGRKKKFVRVYGASQPIESKRPSE